MVVKRKTTREPLTDEQLQELEELWLGRIAVAEIREYRARDARLDAIAEDVEAVFGENKESRKSVAMVDEKKWRLY